MTQTYRITALIYDHKYRNIIYSEKVQYPYNESRDRLRSAMTYLSNRYLEANIVADNGIRVLREMKLGKEVNNLVSIESVNEYYKKNKSFRKRDNFTSYEEYLEYTPISIINESTKKKSESILFNPIKALRVLHESSKNNPNYKTYLYLTSFICCIFKNDRFYQANKNVPKPVLGSIEGQYFSKLWDELNQILKST